MASELTYLKIRGNEAKSGSEIDLLIRESNSIRYDLTVNVIQYYRQARKEHGVDDLKYPNYINMK